MMRGYWERLTLTLENLCQVTAVPEGNIPFLTPERWSAHGGGGLEETLCISPGPLVSPVRCVVFCLFFFFYFWLCWVFISASRGYSLVVVLGLLLAVASLLRSKGSRA